MATASSAQREPSMEEILASIRRIIEDSDSGRRPAGVDDLHRDLESEPAGEVDVPEVDAFRTELRAEPPAVKPITLAEVQAQLAAERQADGDAGHEAPAKRPLVPLSEEARIAEEDEQAPAAGDALVVDTAMNGQRDFGNSSGPVGAATEHHRPEPKQERDTDSVPEAASDAWADETGASSPPAHAEVSAGRPALVSEQTSRQVAAAFGELSEAFASRSRKTFDEMAEEMLRPMLQDWLDNNLPALVERLVREEIERVARGA